MNITNTMCRLSELSQWEIDSLVDNMPISDYFSFYSEELFIGFWSDGRVGTWPADAAQKIVTYTEMMQLLGKTMQFTKSDLKTGMFVKHRGGAYNVVLGNNLNGHDYFGYISGYSDDMTVTNYVSEWDIVAVYNVTRNASLNNYLKGDCLTLIWERTEQTPSQKEMEVLQAQAKALQEQAQAIQEQITKLQGTL
jgi:hypothetical protein